MTRTIAAVSLLAALMVLAWPVLTFADKQLSEEEYTAAMNEMLRHRDRFLLVWRWVEPVKPQRQQVKYRGSNLIPFPPVEPLKPREVTYDYSSVPGMIVEWPR